MIIDNNHYQFNNGRTSSRALEGSGGAWKGGMDAGARPTETYSSRPSERAARPTLGPTPISG
jgi:hypothetical protein